MLNSYGADFLVNLAAGLAYDLIKSGSSYLSELAFGDAEKRLLENIWKESFLDMLTKVASELDTDRWNLVDDILRDFITHGEVVDLLLDLALKGQRPPRKKLRHYFKQVGYYRKHLGVDFDQAMDALVRSLTSRMLNEAKQPESILYKRVNTSRLEVIQTDIQRVISKQIEHGVKLDVIADALSRPKEPARTQLKPEEARRSYLEGLIARLAPQQGILEIGQYIPIPVEVAESPDEWEKRNTREHKSLFSIPATELPRKFILLGASGSGKSTTLRAMVVDSAEKCLLDPSASIPVLVELWQWADSPTFINFLETYVDAENRLLGSLGAIYDLIAQKKVVLFLDGLDEVQDSKRLRYLRDWLDRIPINVVVACRKSDYTGLRRINLPVIEIRHLEDEQIVAFAESYLGDESASEFLATFYKNDPPAWNDKPWHLLHLAHNPLLLMLMLAQFRDKPWGQSPNSWKLLENTVVRLWNRERVLEILQNYSLEAYSSLSQLNPLLAKLAIENVYSTAMDKKEFQLFVGQGLAKALAEAELVQVGLSNIRFRHPLFAEYFIAYSLLNYQDLLTFARRSSFAGALTVLAGYSEQKRIEVQEALLKALAEKEDIDEYSRGPLWALGEVGDAKAINPVVEIYKRTSKGSGLKILGRIVGRLSEDSAEKHLAIDTIAEVLFMNPESELTEDLYKRTFKSSTNYLLEIWGAAEAISEIRTNRAAELLLEGLVKVCSEFEGKWEPMLSTVLRGFAASLARIGDPAIHGLLNAMGNDNSQVASTASEALIRVRFSAPLEPLLQALATHPNSIVRHHIAIKLGQMRIPAAVPHLISALNDEGIWQQGSGRLSFMGVLPTYYFVADSAAYALAQIGTEECKVVLNERLYQEDGNISNDLLMHRLKSDNEIDSNNSLRTQWARYMASRPEGIKRLLPEMGHLRVEPGQLDPIAKAIDQRSEKWNEKPIQQLLDHIEHADDVESRKWSLFLLGRIGDTDLVTTLASYMSEENDPAIRSAAAGGLGILVSRHISTYVDLKTIVNDILLLASNIKLGVELPSIALGLSQISSACLQDNSAITQKILESLMKQVKGKDRDAAKVAVNILDHVFFDLANVFVGFDGDTRQWESADQSQYLSPSLVDEFHQLVFSSPSFHMKLGNDALNRSLYENKLDLKTALETFERVLGLKEQNLPEWATAFTEVDWGELGCDQGTIHYQIGQAHYKASEKDEALRSFQECIAALRRDESLSQRRTWMLARAYLLSGYMLFKDPDKISESLEYFQRAIEVGGTTEDRDLVLDAILSSSAAWKQLMNWQEVIRAAEEALAVTGNDTTRLRKQCLALLILGEAQIKSGNVEAGLRTLERAEVQASRFGLREMLQEIFVRRARLRYEQKDEKGSALDLSAAVHIYEILQDWYGAAELLLYFADEVYETISERSTEYYQQALIYLDRIEAPNIDDAETKALVLRHLADFYEGKGEFSLTERCYELAVTELVRSLEENEVSLAMASLALNYGRYLHRVGKTEEATERTIQAFMILASLGLSTTEAESALSEMSTRPDWDIPSGIVSMITTVVFEALTVAPDKAEAAARMITGMIETAQKKEQSAEEEFLVGIARLLNQEYVALPEDNPYFEPFESLQRNVIDYHILNSNSELVGIILEWVACNEWSSSRKFLETHPELLDQRVELVFDSLIKGFKEKDPEAERILARHLELTHLCNELGTARVYEHLEGPSEIMEAIKELGSVKGWEDARRILHEYPQLLSSEAGVIYEIPIRIERANRNTYGEEILAMNRDLCRMARKIGIDEAIEHFSSPPDLTQALKQFMDAEDWVSSQSLLEKHPELLSPVADAELRMIIHLAQSEGNSSLVSVIQAHRDLLNRCREVGVDTAFKELNDSRELAQVLIDFASTDDWASARAVIDSNPRLLTQDADKELEKLLEKARQNNQPQAVVNLLLYRGILRIFVEEGVDLAEEAFNWVYNPSTVATAIMKLVEAEDWETTARIIEENPELLSPESEKSLRMSIRFAKMREDIDMEKTLQLHLDLIHLCQEVGVDEALVRTKLRSKLGLIAHNTILVLRNTPEEKDEWLNSLVRFLEDSNDPQFQVLLKAIIQLLNGTPVTQPVMNLNNPYADCWNNITEGLIPRDDKEAFERIVHNTVAVMTNYTEGREEWKSIIQRLLTSSRENQIAPNEALFEAILLILNDHQLDSIRPDLQPDSPHFECWNSIIAALVERIEPRIINESAELSSKDEAELNQADMLFIKALELKESTDPLVLEQALEQFADPAQKIYERQRSPRAQEALQLVNELYIKLKRHSI